MALVTIQRSPSPSNLSEPVGSDTGDGGLHVPGSSDNGSSRSPSKSKRSKAALKRLRKLFTTIRIVHRLRFSENYLAVKGAALILPQSECASRSIRSSASGDIQRHLQLMIYLLRPQDTIKVAVKLESFVATRHRYLAVVACTGRQDTEESVVLGIDIEGDKADKATIGLLLPIWGDTAIRLDGDGGFEVTSDFRVHIFKPVSVQAMWSALQSLNKMVAIALRNNYYPHGLTHTWTTYYEVRINSSQFCINEWNIMEDILSKRPDTETLAGEVRQEVLEELMRTKLKDIMMQEDLESVTCRHLRERLEAEMGMKLNQYKAFIDEEMLTILGQMDSPSLIFDFLYLGSEWNASNMDELKKNGVGYILNITREIDNFFPGQFEYYNLRLWDRETTELMPHWDKTYKFIKRAKHSESKVLVHCKMGVSRSAATVIAFAMKEYGWGLERTLEYVKERRAVVRPNKAFMAQLETYAGILAASKQRNNTLWRSPSASNLSSRLSHMSIDEDPDSLAPLDLDLSVHDLAQCRPRSWSPTDGAGELLYKTQHLANDLSSSEDEDTTPTQPSQPEDNLDPCMPFLDPASDLALTFEDEYEVSSRSADSLDIDEAFLDTFTADEKLEALLEHQPVILLSHTDRGFDTHSEITPLSQTSDIQPKIQSEPVELFSEESDFEDFNPDLERKPARGFYDIAMLTGFCPAVAEQPAGREPDGVTSEADWFEYDDLVSLHPDMKLELAMADYRKRCRIAKFIKLHQMSREEMKIYGAQLIQAESSDFNRVYRDQSGKDNAQTSQVKVRKDDFWIRPDPSTPNNSEATPTRAEMTPTKPESLPNFPELNDEEAASPQLGFMQLGGACISDSSTDVDVVESESGFKPIHPMTLTQSPDPKLQQEPLISNSEKTSSPILVPSDRSSAQSAGVKSSESTPREMGVWQHYEKEAIPWSPGTVRRTRQEIEDKYSEAAPKLSTSSPDVSKSAPKSSAFGQEPSTSGRTISTSVLDHTESQESMDVRSRDHMSLELNSSVNQDRHELNPPQVETLTGYSPRSISTGFDSPGNISTPDSVFTSPQSHPVKVVKVTGNIVKRKSFTQTHPTDAKSNALSSEESSRNVVSGVVVSRTSADVEDMNKGSVLISNASNEPVQSATYSTQTSRISMTISQVPMQLVTESTDQGSVSTPHTPQSATREDPKDSDSESGTKSDSVALVKRRSGEEEDKTTPQSSESVSSIYEMEDIPVVPDRVRRIKQIIEERERSSSFGDLQSAEVENKGVQRSSSWKHQRPASERFDRKSARRKTVLPVVRPIPKYEETTNLSSSLDDSNLEKMMRNKAPILFIEKEKESHSTPEVKGQGQEENSEADVKIIQIGGETVELEEGKVKKHQKEYEEISTGGKLATPSRDTRSTSPNVMDSSTLTDRTQSPRDRSKSAVEKETSLPSQQSSKSRTKSESCSQALPFGGTNELVPTFEHILSKSPSLARKLKSEEVIALHSPESPDRTFQKFSQPPKSDIQDSKVSPKSAKTQQSAAIRSQSNDSLTSKRVITKASSVPALNTELSLTPEMDAIKSRLPKEGAQEENGQSNLSIYEEEGISFSVGTVKQQLQAKFESMAVKGDKIDQPIDTADNVQQKVDQSDIVSNMKSDKASEIRQQINQDGKPKGALMTTQSDDVSTESSVVKTITGKIEGKPVKKRKSDRILIIDKDGRKASVARARSLGSHKDLQSKQLKIHPPTQVGRASSFKDQTSNDLSGKDSETTAEKDKSRVFKMVKSEIASHKPVPKKEVVIIPKVVSKGRTQSQGHDGLISGTKHKDQRLSPEQRVQSTASVDDTAVKHERSRDTKMAKSEQTPTAVGSPSAAKGNDSDSSDMGGSSEDISVRELCGIFEARDQSAKSSDTSPSHSLTDSSSSESKNQKSKAAIPKSKSPVESKPELKEAKSKGSIPKSPISEAKSELKDTQSKGVIPSVDKHASPSNENSAKETIKTSKSSAVPTHSSSFSTVTPPSSGFAGQQTVVGSRKSRKLHGKSHPLSKLADAETPHRGKLYSTM